LSGTFDPKAVESQIEALWDQLDAFRPESQDNTTENSPSFSIVIPPPNVTGTLHMGHALDNTIQDILIRWHRMRGDKTLWMPGTDHAGIATQNVVERQLREGKVDGYPKGTSKHDLGREKFLEVVWEWANARKGDILNQFRALGISPDRSRERFTLDEGLTLAVKKAFVTLYNTPIDASKPLTEDNRLIYRGERIVNWCPRCVSAISDIETDYQDEESFLWEIAYKVDGEDTAQLVVATTRPETLFGDAAVAVHPEDERYRALIGRQVRLPMTGRLIPIIADEMVEREFGTGALKITPAHDPNDFVVGKKHGLSPLWIMDEHGKMLASELVPAALHGLERFDARQETEAALEAAGLLISKKEHAHRVGHCQRCATTIEPYLSKQWFVHTKPLADAALEHLKRDEDGGFDPANQLRFIPYRWTHEYTRWMENIQDWCISRQLWWGHTIPAWYHRETGEVYVGMDAPADAENWRQESDVLDTWFSSGLWPFSTMGWPDENAPDLKAFYPTSVLVTGFDIIFFWVARMTMFAKALTKDKEGKGRMPFHTVYIHGLIRDEKGQKMSKSKGNTVDPVDSINQYGCDGFRFGLTSLITHGGQDIKLAKDKLEQGKLFANKLWNASRFVLMNLGTGPIAEAIDPALMNNVDRWMMAKYQETTLEANRLLADYRFGELAQTLMAFVWDNFCDWYVEYAKKAFRGEDAAVAANTRKILLTVLDGILRMLHPIMPYITEALWQQLPQEKHHQTIMHAGYPDLLLEEYDWRDEKTEYAVMAAFEAVRRIRNVRQEYTVPHATQVDVILQADAADLDALQAAEEVVRHFVKVNDYCVAAQLDEAPHQAAVFLVGKSKGYIPLAGIIDVAQEVARLQKKQETLGKEHAKLGGMLGNANFVANAPADVVAKNRERLEELNEQLAAIQEQLASLRA
jgi:valyl-tRNA synthetase